MDVLDTVGKRIRAARNSLRLDQSDLADAAKVHVKTVSRWENDAMAPDSDALRRVAEKLNVDVGWILTGKAPAGTRVSVGGVPALVGGDAEVPLESNADEEAERLLRSHAVRVWLADFRSELTRARASDEEIDRALRLVSTPSVLTFYSRGRVRAFSEEDAITALEAIATPIRAELRKRGRKFV